jgi:hypothetical protein
LNYYWQKIRGIQIQHNNIRIDNFLNKQGSPSSVLQAKEKSSLRASGIQSVSVVEKKKIPGLMLGMEGTPLLHGHDSMCDYNSLFN